MGCVIEMVSSAFLGSCCKTFVAPVGLVTEHVYLSGVLLANGHDSAIVASPSGPMNAY